MTSKLVALVAALWAAISLTGCGGGGGGGGDVVTPASTTLSGVATKGPLKGVLVTAYPVTAGVVGNTELAHTTTSSTGSYTLDVGSYVGAVHLKVTAPAGAKTADEASGSDVDLPAGFVLHANAMVTAASGSQIQNAAITPFTELANNIAKASPGGISAASIANANGVVFTLIGVDPVGTVPVASNEPNAGSATPGQKRYALFNAAVSKLAGSLPSTTDAPTLACYTAAGADLGKKLQCATAQIAAAVTTAPGTGSQPVTTVNTKLVGLADALHAAAADTNINKTGSSILTTDSAFRTLHALETSAAAGHATTIISGTGSQAPTDIAAAKLFFSALRSNAAALESGSVDTGISDGVKAFGDALSNEAAALTTNTMTVAQLASEAMGLWKNFKSGAQVDPYSDHCNVSQGSVPAHFGVSVGGAINQPYTSDVVAVATAPANAGWVGCSVDSSGPLVNNGPRIYRQGMRFNMSADPTLAAVPYTAVSRALYRQSGTTYQMNMTPEFSGTTGFPAASGPGALPGALLVGNLPPAVASDGTLLADHYVVNVALSKTQSSGVETIVLSHGHFGIVPVGATLESLVIDLSPTGTSTVVGLPHGTDIAKAAAAKINLAARISDDKGTLNGTLLIENLVYDGDVLRAGHLMFTGDISVKPVIGGAAGAPVSFLNGSLEFTLLDQTTNDAVVTFTGGLTLPNRPAATLTLSVTETSATTHTQSMDGRYVQNGVTVTITGLKNASGGWSVTFADSTGVSTTVVSGVAKANVTVAGRQTAVIDKDANRITYADGTFESLN